MNFITLFLIVIVWMMSMSASSLADTNRCAKIKKNTSNYITKGSQKTKDTSPFSSDRTSALCSGSISIYCMPSEETIAYQSYGNNIVYTGFISRIMHAGFNKQPYLPPRQLLNI